MKSPIRDKALKPCPFFGGAAEIYESTPPCRKVFWIECRKCWARISAGKTVEAAIAAWERRRWEGKIYPGGAAAGHKRKRREGGGGKRNFRPGPSNLRGRGKGAGK